MAYNLNQQLWEVMTRAKQILVTFRADDEGDGALAALALGEILKNSGKQVDIVCPQFQPPASWQFLPAVKNIKPELAPLQKFIIKVDIGKSKLASLSYDVKDENLYIYLSPKTGLINRADIHTATSDFKFDLVIALGAPDLASLGRLYENNTEMFTRTPVVNIDCSPANEHFGTINLVDISAAATAEIMFEFLSQMAADKLTPNIATLLLTGLIIKTKNFREPNISSRALGNAGKLVDLGAKREDIIHHLFRQRTLPVLKLWGEALVNLKNDPKLGLVWLGLARADFRRAGATEKELPEIIDELLANSPEAKIIALLYETAEGGVAGVVATHYHLDAKFLTQPFSPVGGKNRVKISISGQDLAAAEVAVIEAIKSRLPKI